MIAQQPTQRIQEDRSAVAAFAEDVGVVVVLERGRQIQVSTPLAAQS